MFTTAAYNGKVLQLLLNEASKVANELRLPEDLPIVKSNLVAVYIPPPRLSQRLGGALGNITTSNYTYYISIGNKFSFLEHTHLSQTIQKLRSQYLWPMSQFDTNEAYAVATQLLASASMDAEAISKECDAHVGVFSPDGNNGKYFVPVYWIYWTSKDPRMRGTVADIEFVEPTKAILKLRVNKSKYILRPPLVITNLDYLLSQTNAPASKIKTGK